MWAATRRLDRETSESRKTTHNLPGILSTVQLCRKQPGPHGRTKTQKAGRRTPIPRRYLPFRTTPYASPKARCAKIAEGPPAETRSFVTVQTQKAHVALVGENDAGSRPSVVNQAREVHEALRSIQRQSAPARSHPSRKCKTVGKPDLPTRSSAAASAREPHKNRQQLRRDGRSALGRPNTRAAHEFAAPPARGRARPQPLQHESRTRAGAASQAQFFRVGRPLAFTL